MARNVLVVCGLALVLTAACEGPSNQQQLKILAGQVQIFGKIGTGICTPDADGTNFSQAVNYLDSTFVAQRDYATKDPPPILKDAAGHKVPLPDNIKNDLKSAYNLAPPLFKKALCKLTGVYIDTGSSNSWGYRHPNTHEDYIGISSSLWPVSDQPATRYDLYETARLSDLTGLPQSTFYFGPAQPNNLGAGLTVLAALSHEYGHVLFYELFKSDFVHWNFAFSPTVCAANFFQYWEPPVGAPPPWRYFGQIGAVVNNEHVADPVLGISDNVSVADIKNNYRNEIGEATILKKIYQNNGRWASFLGAYTLDEDFVEMFELIVLLESGLTNLPLYYSPSAGGSIQTIGDIPGGNASRPTLQYKRSCIG